jgi:transcriptional regulator with PAS, ATPase and Fis domain
MQKPNWTDQIPFAITVCDTQGIVLEMNKKSEEVFKDDGGKSLIGQNLMDCHPESARRQIIEMMQQDKSNVYTIEKNGKKKLIYQCPWYTDGAVAGLVEISMELPANMPHFIRD